MGVKGLQSFLKNNEYYLSNKTQINNSSLVIDANNLLCLLFTRTALEKQCDYYGNHIYGGNLVLYGMIVRDFFKSLEQCNITAVLVFDGSTVGKAALREFVGSKEKEVYRRGLDKFNRAKTMNELSMGDEILMPQTINIIFRSVANEFGVQKIQAPYEADAHIARLANELNCSVLTNDSDFLIYNLKKGFFLLDYFDYRKPIVDKATGKASIEGKLYTQDKLAQSVPGLKKDNLPLLSILLGNDYVDGTFDKVVESICCQNYNGHLEARSFNHRKIANLLNWMRGRSLEESIKVVLDSLHPTQRPKIEKLIRLFLLNYHIEIEDDFDKELEQVYPSDKVDPARIELGQTPVKFLRKHMENDDLGSIALDMIFHNTHYNYAILDDFSLPSSSYVKFRPYSLALVLLRPQSYERMTTYKRKIQGERDAFHIYDRLRGEYARLIVRPMEDMENFGTLIHLDCYSMITLEPALKRNMLMACFRFNADEMALMNDTLSQVLSGHFVAEASLCFILVKYIALETKLPPKPQFVDALMITIYYYAALSGNLNKVGIPSDNAYGQLLLKLRPHAITNNGKVYANHDQSLYRRVMHFISQLQVAYKSFCLVNALLDHALQPARMERFFNSTLIFRLTKFFRLGEETLEGLCKDLPTLIDICKSIQTQVHCASS